MMNFGYASFGWIFMFLFWVLVIIGVIAIIKWIMAAAERDTKSENRALDILKERYAKGEIDKTEFEERKKSLL